MANEISKLITPDGVSHDIADTVARQDITNKISRSGDVMTGALVALAFTASANGSPTIVSQSTDVDVSKADNNISSDRYPAWMASDKYGRILTRMECVASSNGNIAAYWYVRNYNTSGYQVAQKGIKIAMAKDGSITYTVDDNSKFRTALGLATVASTGSYNDLSNKPTIPTKTSQLTNDTIFGYSNSISTNNTSDTWIPVFSGSSIQHRVLSTTFNGKSIDGGTNFSGAGIDGQHRILMVDQDGASVKQSCFRSKVMGWGSATTLYCRRNSTALGVVMLNTGSNTETYHIICNGSPSSWKFRRIDSISNATIANLTAGIITKGNIEYAVLFVQGSSNFTMGSWFVTSNTDNP